MKNYNLFLPVFKQGDDLASYLEANNRDPIKSFLDLSEQYKSAAEICQSVAKALSQAMDLCDVEVEACTHSIYLNLPEEIASSLVRDAILVEDDFCDKND